ncbi:FixH family protein [Granulosicoccus sp. 3-233]|uniref:FixH family protein n=1 Tax=Granulosicoccus sp. 3-233 TaxID=3417969 RepID=UPI003D345FE2
MGIAINASIDENDRQTKPWYRYGWPWFLISIPFVSVALGAMMLYLALSANNSLVVDDYYKEGKGINLRIERDRTATLLGLNATLRSADEGLIIDVDRLMPTLPPELHQQAEGLEAVFHWPQALVMQWVHVTRAELDGETVLQSIGGNRYLATGAELPEFGKFRIHLQPADQAPWRLVSSLEDLHSEVALSITYRAPDEVFNTTEFK